MKNKNLFIFASLFWVQVKPKTETKAMAKTIKQKQSVFSRDEATLYERVSVRWSVRWSVGR